MLTQRTVFDLHRPLRRHLQRFALFDSLYVVRAYEQHLQFHHPFPPDIEVAPYFLKAAERYDKKVFEWELDILARELFLWACDVSTTSLRYWNEFSKAVNCIKTLGNEVTGSYAELYKPNILIELYRIAHNQFPWQRGITRDTILRYFKIFGTADFDPILRTRTGLSASELYTIGMALSGHFSEQFMLDLPAQVKGLQVTVEQIDQFVMLFSADVPTLRADAAKNQSYDQDYEYVFNPLRKFPLVRIPRNADVISVAAPLPTFLMRRFTEGVYYELLDAKGFSEAFGKAFQAYTGDVLSVSNSQRRLNILPECPFDVGKDRKDSVDWIVSDATADLFVECKTKRIRREAKIRLASTEVLSAELEKMAEFIVQTYKTLIDALNSRYPHWASRDKPIYTMIVTLEEWFAFGDRLTPALDEAVLSKLKEENIAAGIVQKYPYTICAIEDFEIAIQIMSNEGIDVVMRQKTDAEHRLWAMYPFLGTVMGRNIRLPEELFPEDWRRIHPGLGSIEKV